MLVYSTSNGQQIKCYSDGEFAEKKADVIKKEHPGAHMYIKAVQLEDTEEDSQKGFDRTWI